MGCSVVFSDIEPAEDLILVRLIKLPNITQNFHFAFLNNRKVNSLVWSTDDRNKLEHE